MMTKVDSVAETVADSVWGKLLARYATPLLMAVAVWLGNNYLGNLQDTLNGLKGEIALVKDDAGAAADKAAAIGNRVDVLENTLSLSAKDRDQFQDLVIAEIRDMRSTIVVLSNKVSALDATISAMRDRAALRVAPGLPSR